MMACSSSPNGLGLDIESGVGASIAARNGVFLEVSGRRSHAYANGHVVRMAREAGGPMVLDSDAHEPGDLMTREFAMKVALGAGLDEGDAAELLDRAPRDLMARLEVGKLSANQ